MPLIALRRRVNRSSATDVSPDFKTPAPSGTKTVTLAVGALGVVYGDIGTSPLYAVKECFHGPHAIALNEATVLGVLSLVFWSLVLVVTVKYIAFILLADNRGEGGIFALLSLIPGDPEKIQPHLRGIVIIAGIAGAALLYGDGMITPSISVLSAMEGIRVATTAADPLILPMTCIVLFCLFFIQHRGTGRIGALFGPVILIWFMIIGTLGVFGIFGNPHVLSALNPLHTFRFFAENGFHGAVVLGSVVLCITGVEALYADLGHFGRKAIRLSWVGVVFPALLLNYFGQGALLLAHPERAYNPFYGLVPPPLLYPMVALSTLATVIASQAMISGVFSLTQQAIQLGYLPRLRIVHTSSETRGQIYIPQVNYMLMVACIGLVLAFRGSDRLAGAYGIAVTATMGITSLLYFIVITRVWGWPLIRAVPLLIGFLVVDLAFFGTNLLKIPTGGWFTLAAAAVIMIAMTAWKDGRRALSQKKRETHFPVEHFIEDVSRHKPYRVKGAAVFMTISPRGTPAPLLHHFKHNHVLHEKVILLSIRSADTPTVADRKKLRIQKFDKGFYRVIATHGFMETPNAPRIMRRAADWGIDIDPDTITYFLGRETLVPTGSSKMAKWRKILFILISRNAWTVPAYFGIPSGQVVEMGTQIEL